MEDVIGIRVGLRLGLLLGRREGCFVGYRVGRRDGGREGFFVGSGTNTSPHVDKSILSKRPVLEESTVGVGVNIGSVGSLTASIDSKESLSSLVVLLGRASICSSCLLLANSSARVLASASTEPALPFTLSSC